MVLPNLFQEIKLRKPSRRPKVRIRDQKLRKKNSASKRLKDRKLEKTMITTCRPQRNGGQTATREQHAALGRKFCGSCIES